jgi:hypothetical protein
MLAATVVQGWARVVARHRREHIVPILSSALRIVTVTPSSGPPAKVSAVDPDFTRRLGTEH